VESFISVAMRADRIAAFTELFASCRPATSPPRMKPMIWSRLSRMAESSLPTIASIDRGSTESPAAIWENTASSRSMSSR
jgi:hypothetical protein